jgi:hypothetical protein
MRRLRRILIELARSERGIALPMALMITVIAMGFAAVPVVASINAQSGDSHSQGGNEALAAAEAGAELAVLRQGEQLQGDQPNVPCLEGTSLQSTGWCTATLPKTIGAASFVYQVRPCFAESAAGGPACTSVTDVDDSTSNCATASEMRVVSTGTATVGGREVHRRVVIDACVKTGSSTPPTPGSGGTTTPPTEPQQWETERDEYKKFEGEWHKKWEEKKTEIEKEDASGTSTEAVPGTPVITPPPNVWGSGQIVGVEGLAMSNNAQVFNGGVGSNKAVSMIGSANVCGTVRYGTTFTPDNSTSSKAPDANSTGCAVGRTVSQGTATYPALTLPSDIATNNSDYRLCNESICHAGLDPVTSGTWQRENIIYDAANKRLTLKYNALTLEGTAPYYLCQLILQGGASLYSGAGKSIKIYFAPPSACPGLNGSPQLQIANGAYVYADAASGPQFLFVGSTTKASDSKIEFAGGAKTEQFVVYAPYSQIVINNGIEMSGAIIGNTIELAGGAKLNKNGAFTPPPAEGFLPPTETPGTPGSKSTPTHTQHENEFLEDESEWKHWKAERERVENEPHTTPGTPGSSNPGDPGSTGTTGPSSIVRERFSECVAEPSGLSQAEPAIGCTAA